MASDLMYGLIGAAVNAAGTMFGTQIDRTTGGLYSKTALGLPNVSQFNQIGNAIGVPISKVDELLLLGDAAALGYGVLGKKKEATMGGIGGLLGWFVSKKFLHGEFQLTDNSVRIRYGCGCIYDLDTAMMSSSLTVKDFTLCVKHKELLGPKIVKEKD